MSMIPQLAYCSTTDWNQHKYAPTEEHSLQHIAELDRLIGQIVDDNPEREIYITADHAMLPKNRALDPGRWLTEHGVPSSAIPIIKDRYVAHHGNSGRGGVCVSTENQRIFRRQLKR